MAAHRKLWLAAAAPPVAWMAQGAIGWFLTAEACPPSLGPLSFGGARTAVAIITAVALAISIAGFVAARRQWRALTTPAGESREATTTSERVRFVAMLGLLVCVTLTLGLCMAGLPSLVLQRCGETR
jgi:hypothetical protein